MIHIKVHDLVPTSQRTQYFSIKKEKPVDVAV
jgi:hypothetical protein